MTRTELWKFSKQFEETRKERLSSINTFSEIIKLINESIADISVTDRLGKDPELKECIQPIFTFKVSKIASDAFFNSPAGYRACYLQDPILGLIANLMIIESMTQRLLDVAKKTENIKLNSINIKKSLQATSCKIWIKEPFPIAEELAVDTWVEAYKKDNELAKYGLSTPISSQLEIKGALLDPKGNEVVPHKKILRHYDIHNFGFS